MGKDFAGWGTLKVQLDEDGALPLFKEREIWWCSVGVNVGYEIFGKDRLYSRPVLVLKKYTRNTFFGLPLTSRRKEHSYHYHINFGGKEGSVLLDQGRVFDSRRLQNRMGRLYQHETEEIKTAFINSI